MEKKDFTKTKNEIDLGGFKCVHDTLDGVPDSLKAREKSTIPFGVSFLDDATGGIWYDDLVILGAATGVGKTELAIDIALSGVASGKRVYYLALEASAMEMESRITYKSLEPYYKMNYKDFYGGKYVPESAMEQAREDAKVITKTLFCKYKDNGPYTIQSLNRDIFSNVDNADLFIVDHLHFFDTEGFNENREVKEIMMKIRDLVLYTQKAVLLVSHLRKMDKGSTVPTNNDFHGTSDITKIGTKVITIAPAFNIPRKENHLYPTYMKITKSRASGPITRYTAVVNFNIWNREYAKEYLIGTVKKGEFSSVDNPLYL